jgi:N-acetylneuraminate synthase|tara:strand:- start:113 stop:1144 length:1032 start_codon:yes stop_codon:yes gene_type:complete
MLKIKNRIIDFHSKPLIIPELGINHGGNIEKAIKIVDAAKRAGAEIIKHQTHIPEDEMSLEAKKISPGNSKNNIFSIIKNNSLNEEDEYKLLRYVESKKMIFISTPFSRKAVDRLVKFNVPAFKIGSGEMSNFPLLDYVSKFKKPIILSTGLHSLRQVKKTSNFLTKRKVNFALMHTTNIYPTQDKLLRLNSIKELQKTYPRKIIGLSDHTGDLLSSIIALSLGAKIIEKHFINDNKIKGPDISSSIDEKQLAELILYSTRIENQLKGTKNILKEEEITRKFAFASVVTIKKIKKGEKLTKKNIWVKRPGTGYFKAENLNQMFNKKAKKDLHENRQIRKNDIN